MGLIGRAGSLKRAARIILSQRRRAERSAARKAGVSLAKLKRERLKASVEASFDRLTGKVVGDGDPRE